MSLLSEGFLLSFWLCLNVEIVLDVAENVSDNVVQSRENACQIDDADEDTENGADDAENESDNGFLIEKSEVSTGDDSEDNGTDTKDGSPFNDSLVIMPLSCRS